MTSLFSVWCLNFCKNQNYPLCHRDDSTTSRGGCEDESEQAWIMG